MKFLLSRRQRILSLGLLVLSAFFGGCTEPDALLREKATAALAQRTDLTQNKSIQTESAQVYVGKSAATVVIPYGVQKADGTTQSGSIIVSFKNMAKRWEVDQVIDALSLR